MIWGTMYVFHFQKRSWLDQMEALMREESEMWILTTFMSTRSSSNQATLSLSFDTLAMYMQANAIKCGGWIRIRSILYVSLTIPLHILKQLMVNNLNSLKKFIKKDYFLRLALNN